MIFFAPSPFAPSLKSMVMHNVKSAYISLQLMALMDMFSFTTSNIQVDMYVSDLYLGAFFM